ncbi:MFS transporter [Lactobacillus sp. M0403]|uniref:MFS transporter n=1 Tax=Lactobacillus TaxID=1578 RepID=UPI0018DC0FB5|nr:MULTISPECIES: MFS transporter [Lactobacillus]MBI0092468.1 MFS transporter [Lactobacillus sp. M0403]MCO6530009.1 MFS transporter [Lactobacillus sp.]MCT6821329.1 MFS transporter [Lactobacillus apis]
MKKVNPKSGLFKVALLSISLLLMIAPQISSVLPLMYSSFPGVSRAAVETLSTIPNIGIVIGLIISPFLIKLIGTKNTVITGLVIALLAGTYPMYATGYTTILISRFLLGAGIGLFNSLAVSLLSKFYQGDELSSMLGFQNSMGSVGAAIFSFCVGLLAVNGWHATFAIYFAALPILLLFGFVVKLPSQSQSIDTEAQPATKEENKINGAVIEIAIIMFFMYVFFMPMSFKLPQLATSQKLASVSQIAFVSSVVTLIGIPVGMCYGLLKKKLKDLILPIGLFLQVAGLLAIAYAVNLPMLVVAVIVLGAGFGLSVPYIFNWLDEAAPKNSVNFATTITLILVNIGCAASPTIVNWLGTTFGGGTPRSDMTMAGIGMAVLFCYSIVHYFQLKKKHN